jgi:ABC-2 type transport system permease protein
MGYAFDFDVFKGSYRYSMLQTFRYMNAGFFVGLQIIGPIFFLLTSWTILQIIGPSALLTFTNTSGFADYIPFVILGFAFQAVIMNAVWSGSNGIRNEQQAGTVEAIFVTPSSKVAWMLGKIAGNITMALVSTSIVLTVGSVVFSFTLRATPNIPAAVIGLLLTLAGMTAFAFALAGLTFLAKRADDINQVLWTSLVFFTGLAFPVEALPQWAQAISWVFPITHGLAITRGAILKGYSIFDPNLLFPVVSVLILTLVYIPIGYFSFRTFFDKARRKGALTGY